MSIGEIIQVASPLRFRRRSGQVDRNPFRYVGLVNITQRSRMWRRQLRRPPLR